MTLVWKYIWSLCCLVFFLSQKFPSRSFLLYFVPIERLLPIFFIVSITANMLAMYIYLMVGFVSQEICLLGLLFVIIGKLFIKLVDIFYIKRNLCTILPGLSCRTEYFLIIVSAIFLAYLYNKKSGFDIMLFLAYNDFAIFFN